MKTYLTCAILAAGLMSIGAAAGRGQTISANVPFGFQVNNTEMPAGKYSLKQLHEGSPVLIVSNWQTRKSVMIMTSPLSASADERSRLIFRCDDHGCSLTEVWGATSSAGAVLSQPHPRVREGGRLAVVYVDRNRAGN